MTRKKIVASVLAATISASSLAVVNAANKMISILIKRSRIPRALSLVTSSAQSTI